MSCVLSSIVTQLEYLVKCASIAVRYLGLNVSFFLFHVLLVIKTSSFSSFMIISLSLSILFFPRLFTPFSLLYLIPPAVTCLSSEAHSCCRWFSSFSEPLQLTTRNRITRISGDAYMRYGPFRPPRFKKCVAKRKKVAQINARVYQNNNNVVFTHVNAWKGCSDYSVIKYGKCIAIISNY